MQTALIPQREKTDLEMAKKMKKKPNGIKTLFECCTHHFHFLSVLFFASSVAPVLTDPIIRHQADGLYLSFSGKIVLGHTSTRSPVTPLLTLPLSPLHLFSHCHVVNHPPSPSPEYTSHCDDPVCLHPGKKHTIGAVVSCLWQTE